MFFKTLDVPTLNPYTVKLDLPRVVLQINPMSRSMSLAPSWKVLRGYMQCVE